MVDILDEARERTAKFQDTLVQAGHEITVITDESSIAYLAGFWGYLSVEFGRPTFLVLRSGQAPVVLTPLMECEMVSAMTWVDDIRTWQDAGDMRWENVLAEILGPGLKRLAVERDVLPAVVRNWLDEQYPGIVLGDASAMLGTMRMIKSPSEINVMKNR